MKTTATEKPRCQAVIYKRDTYRYSGRGCGGFSMHYTKAQCSRAAKDGEWCCQHAKMNPAQCSFASPYLDQP